MLLASSPLPPKGTAFWFCICFAVSNLASPFGERWAREGSERGSSLAGLYGLADLVRFCLRGSGWGRCVGWEAV